MRIARRVIVEVDPAIVSSPCFRLEMRTHYLYIWRRGWRPGLLIAPIEP